MKNNKILIITILTMIVLCTLLSGCGNRAWFSESIENEFYYIVIKDGDECVLHEIKKWADYESDALFVETKCCDNMIMTSYYSATLYKEIPNLNGITKCWEMDLSDIDCLII